MLSLAVVVALVALSGFTDDAADAVEPVANEVHLVATDDPDAPFAFEPVELTVEAGTTVHWTNTTGDVFHTVTFSDSIEQRVANEVFNESLFAAGDTVEFEFKEPGEYAYFCQPHAEFMAAMVIVAEPGGLSEACRWWGLWVAGSLGLVALVMLSSRRARRTVKADGRGPA